MTLTALSSRKAALVVTALAIVLGTALRFHALTAQSVWDDESFTVRNITSSWRAAAYQPVNNHPPLYFAQLRLWRHLGGVEPHSLQGVAFLRANAAFWGSLSLVLFYLLARRYFSPWLTAAGVAIMVLSPLHLAFSQDARPYTLAAAIGLAGFLLMEWFIRHGRSRAGACLVIGALWVLELYTHYWGVFIAAAQLVYGLAAVQERRRRLQLVIVFTAALLVFAVWWPVLRFHLQETADHGSEWFTFGPADLGKTFVSFSGIFFQFGHQIFVHPWQQWITVAAIILIVGLPAAGLVKGPRLPRLWLAIGIGLPFLLGFWRPLYLWYRYPFLSYAAFVLLILSGLSLVKPRWLRACFIAFILSVEAAACVHYFSGWQKGNAGPVIAYVHQLQTPDSILVRPRYFADVMSYYDHTPAAQVIDEGALDSPEKRGALRQRQVIFLAFDVPSDPVGEALLAELPVRSRRHFPAIPLHGITVYELGADTGKRAAGL
jgi:hypothetical protein